VRGRIGCIIRPPRRHAASIIRIQFRPHQSPGLVLPCREEEEEEEEEESLFKADAGGGAAGAAGAAAAAEQGLQRGARTSQ